MAHGQTQFLAEFRTFFRGKRAEFWRFFLGGIFAEFFLEEFSEIFFAEFFFRTFFLTLTLETFFLNYSNFEIFFLSFCNNPDFEYDILYPRNQS